MRFAAATWFRSWFLTAVLLSGAGVNIAAEQAAPKLDRYGDPLPEGALLRLGTVRLRQPDGHCVALSPDGKRLVSAGDHSARIWDVASGAKLREIPHGARSVAFSPDGKSIALAGDDGVLRLWDLGADKERFARKGKVEETGSPKRIHGVAFAPDGAWIVVSAEDVVTLHDAAMGDEILALRHDGQKM